MIYLIKGVKRLGNNPALDRYRKNNIIQKSISLNINTDMDIIEHIDSIDNFNGYVKNLIRFHKELYNVKPGQRLTYDAIQDLLELI